MAAKRHKGAVLRKMASHVIEQAFGDIPDGKGEDLATSLVRQWLTNAGVARVIVWDGWFVFHLEERDDGYHHTRDPLRGRGMKDLAQQLSLREEDIPGFQHSLNVRHRAEATNRFGDEVAVRIDLPTGELSINNTGWLPLGVAHGYTYDQPRCPRCRSDIRPVGPGARCPDCGRALPE
jgi:hypothetical protein